MLTDYNDDLDTAKPKLELSKELDAEVVDEDDGDEEDGDKDAGIDMLVLGDPILDDKCGGSKLVWRDNDVFEKVALKSRLVSSSLGLSSRALNDGRGTYHHPRANPSEGWQYRDA